MLLKTVLDTTKIGKADVEKIQKIIDKYNVNVIADIDTAPLIKEVKRAIPELEAELKKVASVDINVNNEQLYNTLNQVVKDNQRIQQELDKTAQKAGRIQLSIGTGFSSSAMEESIKFVNILDKSINKLNSTLKDRALSKPTEEKGIDWLGLTAYHSLQAPFYKAI